MNFSASADGQWFAYLSQRSSDAVYLGKLKPGAGTLNPQRLTLDEWDSTPFDWTRDSKAVLFESVQNNRATILKQGIGQQNPEILVSGSESHRRPSFSPSGDRLLYTISDTADRSDPSKRLMSMPLDGGGPSVLLAGDYTYHCGSVPASGCVLAEPEGEELIFSTLDPVAGKGAEIQRVRAYSGVEWFTCWSLSPDGNKIAIVDPAANKGAVRILTLTDRKIVPLALQGWKWGVMQSVAWSADGKPFIRHRWKRNIFCDSLH